MHLAVLIPLQVKDTNSVMKPNTGPAQQTAPSKQPK